MKAAQVEKIRRRAVKAGIRRSRKLHHSLEEEEILSLKVQVLPFLPRFVMGAAGTLLVLAGGTGWPSDADDFQIVEIIAGVFLILSALVGVRRTLSEIADRLSTDALHSIVDSVVDAIDL